MPDAAYSPKDALRAVQDRTLEDWLNSHWDLLCAALNFYQDSLSPGDFNDSLTMEAIRRVRMEIVVGNRLSDVKNHTHDPDQGILLPGGAGRPSKTSAR